MLMNKLDVLAESIPLYKEWVISGRTKKYFREYFNDLKNKTVLEIGCGNGEGSRVIGKYFSPKKIIATEFDAKLLEIAKRNIISHNIIFEQQDAAALSYKNNQFDGIFSYKVIHHIPNWEDCLKEFYRVLNFGGKVFIIEDSIESFSTFWGKILRLTTSHPYDSLYSRKEFINYLQKVGFKILKHTTTSQYLVLVVEKIK